MRVPPPLVAVVLAFSAALACNRKSLEDHGAPLASAPGAPIATASGSQPEVGSRSCRADADCVPATCCHASACTARANAPHCEDAMCTKECRGGTIDCGGGCLCQGGLCTARIVNAPR